jgi:nucleotide-binding universal stress UspA family protein
MYGTILLATDGSPAAEQAANAALALADEFDAAVHAIHVRNGGDRLPGVEDEEADEFAHRGTGGIERFADSAAAAGIDATTATVEGQGSGHDRILEYARGEGADLVVVGTAGHTGVDRLVLGSVAEQLLRSAAVPVLTVHEDTPLDELDAILVPTDGSDPARRAAEHAADLAAALGSTLHVINVVDLASVHGSDLKTVEQTLTDAGEEAVEDVVELARTAGVDDVESTVVTGRPADGIVEHASDLDASLIVIGTHGRQGVDRVLLGSVAERVVRCAEVPVLGVRARDE